MEEFKAKLIEALKDEDVLRILNKSIENSIMDKSNELDGNMLIEFKDELRIYELYKSIDEDELKVLKGIFKGNTLKEFLYCGIQYRNIEALWDYTANKIMKKDYSNLNKLNAIIIFFINSYNLLFEEKVFIIDDEKILSDPNRGHWDLWDIKKEGKFTVNFNEELVARNPLLDIKEDGVIGIDFGTKSTVVVFQENGAYTSITYSI